MEGSNEFRSIRPSPCHHVTLVSLQAPPPCVSVNKQQRLACKRQFLSGWIAKKRKFTIGSIRRGSQDTSPLSWTVTAAGHDAGTCRALPGTGPELRRYVRPWKRRHVSEFPR